MPPSQPRFARLAVGQFLLGLLTLVLTPQPLHASAPFAPELPEADEIAVQKLPRAFEEAFTDAVPPLVIRALEQEALAWAKTVAGPQRWHINEAHVRLDRLEDESFEMQLTARGSNQYLKSTLTACAMPRAIEISFEGPASEYGIDFDFAQKLAEICDAEIAKQPNSEGLIWQGGLEGTMDRRKSWICPWPLHYIYSKQTCRIEQMVRPECADPLLVGDGCPFAMQNEAINILQTLRCTRAEGDWACSYREHDGTLGHLVTGLEDLINNRHDDEDLDHDQI